MKQDFSAFFPRVLFYGSLWGIAEGCIGFMLHLVSRLLPVPGLAGFIMFPLGCIFMLAVWEATGSRSAIPLTAAVAAAAKLVSVLHPAVTPLFVINPALAILSEGAAAWLTAAFVPDIFRRAGILTYSAVGTGAALLWHLLFLILVLFLPVPKGILNKGPESLVFFVLVEGSVSGLLLGAGLFLRYRLSVQPGGRFVMQLQPAVPGLLFILAGLAQLPGNV